jgi:opacity protein-like surface antigen
MKTKKLLSLAFTFTTTIFMLCILCFMAFALTAMAATTPTPTAVANTSLFNAGELGVSLGTGYTVDRANLFKAPYTLNLEAGAFYFPWRNVGFEARVPFYQSHGVSVSEIQAGALLRLPLSSSASLLKNIAPYIGLGGVYNWQTAQEAAYIAKIGTDFRFNSKWGIFVEGQFRNRDFNMDRGQTTVAGGIKLVF